MGERIDAARRYREFDEAAYAPISIDGPDAAERIYDSARRELGGQQLNRAMVAAVMHALADYSLNQRMVSQSVANLAIRPLAYDPEPYPADLAHGLGRWFHGIGDRIQRGGR